MRIPVLPAVASFALFVSSCSFEGASSDVETPPLVDSGVADSAVTEDATFVETDGGSLPACFATYNDLTFGTASYRFLEDFSTFDNASAACSADGGRLATIETDLELEALSNYLTENLVGVCIGGCGWVGLSQQSGAAEPGGGWVWSDGSAFDPNHWNNLEPNNIFALEDCGQLVDGGLNDLGCEVLLRGICECQPI